MAKNFAPETLEFHAAMASLIRNQAAFAEHVREHHETVARIWREFDEIKRILRRHERILANLPDAIRQKVGFQHP